MTNPTKLKTTVQDPTHPGEPWTIETIQKDGESLEEFIRRHHNVVVAARRFLTGR